MLQRGRMQSKPRVWAVSGAAASPNRALPKAGPGGAEPRSTHGAGWGGSSFHSHVDAVLFPSPVSLLQSAVPREIVAGEASSQRGGGTGLLPPKYFGSLKTFIC